LNGDSNYDNAVLTQYPGANWCPYPQKPNQTTQIAQIEQLRGVPDKIKQWLQSSGPVVAVMLEYEDLSDWKNGLSQVYKPADSIMVGGSPSPNRIVGGHVVSIVGYGRSDSVPYWICQNSWGTTWNAPAAGSSDDYGYFLVQEDTAYDPDKDSRICYIDSIDVWGITM
jgi:C1A family cysteine protease